jgi:hypothetical protein
LIGYAIKFISWASGRGRGDKGAFIDVGIKQNSDNLENKVPLPKKIQSCDIKN